MRKLIGLAVLAAAGAALASPVVFTTCDRRGNVCAAGEEVVFSVDVQDKAYGGWPVRSGKVTVSVDNFGPRVIVPEKTHDLAEANPVLIRCRLDEPGFLRVNVRMDGVTNCCESVAVSPEKIVPGAAMPDDFRTFWQEAVARYDAEVPEDVELRPVPQFATDTLEVFEVILSVPGGRRIYGLLTRPKDLSKGPYPLLVESKGAGPADLSAGDRGKDGRVTLVMNVHYYEPPVGARKKDNYPLHNREVDRLAARYPTAKRGYEFTGIAVSREDYFYYGSILGNRRAVLWAVRQDYVDRANVGYLSTSQGGGMGFYMAALCPVFRRAVMCVPALTDLLGFRTGRMSGWPRLVEAQLEENKPAAERFAPYYDAANFATLVTCPTRVVVGFSDTICPPCAVYSAYNRLASADKRILHGVGMTHAVRRQYYERLYKWVLDRPDAVKEPYDYVDTMIGTEGSGTQYGGMMPYTCTPFGSIHAVAMTRQNAIGCLSFNQADETLQGVILTRQPNIWMGDWGEVRIPLKPARIEEFESAPHLTRVKAGGLVTEFTAADHSAWLRFSKPNADLLGGSGFCTNRMDGYYSYPLPNFRGWYYVDRPDAYNLRIGVSLISLEQAKENLAREMPSGDAFETVAARTRERWRDQLGRVTVEAPEKVKTIFYTGVFHATLYPRRIDEYGRYYSAFDDRVHEGREMYTSFSLWDNYRAEHPLLTLICPERVDGMMDSLLRMYREGGWLPKWPNPSYTGIMTGSPAEIVLAEAVAKGFRGFDWNLAYEAMRKSATVPQKDDFIRNWTDRGEFGRYPETRGGLTWYMKHGYVAYDITSESVSRTLDFGFDDKATALVAEKTGHAGDAAYFRARSRNYTNLWCAAERRFLPRPHYLRGWHFIREPNTSDYTECTPFTALFCVPYDIPGMLDLVGGTNAFERLLDEYFDTVFWKPERGNRSIHGNEPSHHVSYLYNLIGRPEKTQRQVRKILETAYSDDRVGFEGNEDTGQMSAWYVLSSLGLYMTDPTTAEYQIGSPIVKSATLRFGAPYAPATLRIRVANYAPERWRVRRALLNGRELTDWKVSHADLVRGGELVFEMAER